MLNFRKARNEDKEKISSLLSSTVEGAAAFSVLYTAHDISDFFYLGEDVSKEIKSVIFDTGDLYFLVYGEEFPVLFTRKEKIIMIYGKSTCRKGNAKPLLGKEILDLYKLLSETSSLSFDDERRYVLRLKAVNTGLAAVFGIYEKGKLISSASVSSENEKYALIADVFTEKSHRGKGLAEECLMTAAEYILSKGKTPILLCDENMCPYYKKAGFDIYGKM